MPKYTTPGVYVQEAGIVPHAVVEVASGVPAFVGYTQRVTHAQVGDLTLHPQRIASLVAFEALFGNGIGIHWEDIDEDISVRRMILGGG